MQRPVVWALLPIWAVLLVTGPVLSQSTVPQARQLFDQARQVQSDRELDEIVRAAQAPGADECAWLDLGRAYLHRGMLEQAIAAFRRATEVAPGNIVEQGIAGS